MKVNASLVCWCIVALVQIAWCDPTQTVKINTPACCAGDNVLDEKTLRLFKIGNDYLAQKCLNGTNGRLPMHCSAGHFMLDPMQDETDAYSINSDGHLLVEGSKEKIEEYCTTNLLAKGQNKTRPVALYCVYEYDEETALILFLLKGCMAIVSVVFIIATLYVYYLIPDLRETQDKATCIALSCLLGFLLFLASMQIIGPDLLGVTCKAHGYLVYFLAMAYFAWLNVVMLNVWKTSVWHKCKMAERTWYILNHVYGWTIPTVMLIILVVNRDGHFGQLNCFFSSKRSIFLFLHGPMCVMLLLNVILFVWSAWGIHSSGQDVSPDRKRALTYKFRLYVKLIFLAGLTWVLEVISSVFGTSASDKFTLWLIADVINALLGFLIFLVLVVWRPRIRKELSGKRILCLHFPSSWGEAQVADEETLHEPDENTKYDLISK